MLVFLHGLQVRKLFRNNCKEQIGKGNNVRNTTYREAKLEKGYEPTQPNTWLIAKSTRFFEKTEQSMVSHAEKLQSKASRVVLRGDIVKDDSGSYEQGSSASQMTAAKVMDIISRLPGCAGQAADAVSADIQVKIEDAPKLLKIPKSECPGIWIRLPRHNWPKSWSSVEDPVVPLERNLHGHPLEGLLWERQFEKILLK